ncbi:MAG: MMPL family transporter [Rhodospirillales bacterium]|nr:MMPL family transporter [Rhodospirillales bacterium]
MPIQRLLVQIAEFSRRHAARVVLVGMLVVVLSVLYAAGHLGVSTDTDQMFAASLPWRQREMAFDREFPQFNNLLVLVIDAAEPEEADATAAALAAKLRAEPALFHDVSEPDRSAFLQKEGLLFLPVAKLRQVMNQTIDAQPFIGQLVADPSARGLFSALALIGVGAQRGDANLKPYAPALDAFHRGLAAALAGHPAPLSWQSLLGGDLAKLAGRYRFVLVHPKLDYGALEPGGVATKAVRAIAAQLPFVKAGAARVRITGQIALSDEEFASVAEGMMVGLIGSVLLITLWLFLAVRSWRLIVPILMTLVLGLALTLLFASIAVGTLNLVSVGFGVLFVGIAVDFAIQFCVRYRERRFEFADKAEAMRQTAGRVGEQILVAAVATAAGFLAFVPTAFSGVAELGLIAGVGMVIAFACTVSFLPAAIALFRPAGERAMVGFAWAVPLDPLVRRWRRPILAVFAAVALAGAVLAPRVAFDSNPLDTKNPHTEAMRTLRDLMGSAVTNPFTIDVMAPNVAAAARLASRLDKLPTVADARSLASFVPGDQKEKLAIIADAAQILGPTLLPLSPVVPASAAQIRLAAKTALGQIEAALPKLPPDSPLRAIATDLRQLSVAPDPVLMATNAALTRFLPAELDQLRTALSAAPVTEADVPPAIRRDWLLADGRARVQVTPKVAVSRTSAGLHAFVRQVVAVAPNAGGPAVTVVATSRTIVGAFSSAALYALAAITLILVLALRRLRDVALVLAPLLLSALMTMLVAVALPLPLNYANIIALPLLLGVGVAFNIYFVMNWRAGRHAVLGSATARAIVFSALTTGTAFGSLALSHHPGTASMGALLLISLGCTLVASLVFVPALLASLHQPEPH